MVQHVFSDIKVLDFTRVIAGPLATEYLAEYGATVIRVESSKSPDTIRVSAPYKDGKIGIDRSGYFASYNANKYSVSLNLEHPMSVNIVKRLVKWSDIVIENFSPKMARKLGITYEEFRKTKPDIIMLSSSSQGQTGPLSDVPGYGFSLCGLCGFTNLTGWRDREPCHPFGALTDFITPCINAISLIAALEHRRLTGNGQYIDVSQYESGLLFMMPQILDYIVNGHQLQRNGNRRPWCAPHGAYPCKGEDRWCAITVCNEQQWVSLCQVMGKPELATDMQFNSLDKRKANEDRLDDIISGWTSRLTAEEVMEALQKVGVPSGIVKTPVDIFEDPQLRYRQHFKMLEHPEIGYHSYEMSPFCLSATPASLQMPAPCLGQHNEYVYKELLEISEGEFAQLMAEGVFE